MKLIPLKLGIALGSAFGILFFICNVLLPVVSNEVTLQLMKIIFHEMDFNSLMIDNSFHFLHLVCGIGILFVVGGLTGYLTAIIYNAACKQKVIIELKEKETQRCMGGVVDTGCRTSVRKKHKSIKA